MQADKKAYDRERYLQRKREREEKQREEQQRQEEAQEKLERRRAQQAASKRRHQAASSASLCFPSPSPSPSPSLEDLQRHCRELEGKLQKRKNTIIQQQQTIEELSQQLEKQREREGKEEKEREPLLQLINRLIELCKSMNQNNPLRRQLVAVLTQDWQKEEVYSRLRISRAMLRRGRRDLVLKRPIWRIVQRAPNILQPRRRAAAKQQFWAIVNDIAPCPSGRNYHVYVGTRRGFYLAYTREHRQRGLISEPLSYGEVMYHLLARRRGRSREEAACLVRFHWKRKAKWCHKCRRYEELAAKKEVNDLEEEEKKEWPKLEDHHCLQYAQRSHYLKTKHQLAQGEALILQDFTQLKTEAGGFYQDLNFVAGVWETLLESTWKDFKKLIVFSDGCGRQFKCTKHMAWMRSVACDRNLPVDYNFFASNHGYNQCDVIGAQAQRTLVCWELDRGSEGKDARLKVPQDIAAVISTTKGHKGSVAPTPKKIDKVTTRQGLKDWHRIEYQPDGTLHVWHASTDTVPRATLKFTDHKSFVFTTGADSRKRREEVAGLLLLFGNRTPAIAPCHIVHNWLISGDRKHFCRQTKNGEKGEKEQEESES